MREGGGESERERRGCESEGVWEWGEGEVGGAGHQIKVAEKRGLSVLMRCREG